ncbi:ABC transporter permease subunit [Bacillus sp. Marseille-Q3570]|uniref:ABC transporter permease subunit n=1 Tax=Bacillus sp. Marseille-Q3570 TaxID=2963522 RepID=UPI0021B7A9F5|nr:ABC transporter permease subunit [Bacillus sp. Marseille-Q3570]
MVKSITNSVVRFLFVVIGIVMISAFLGMTMYKIDISFMSYFQNLKKLVILLVNPSEIIVYKDIYSIKYPSPYPSPIEKNYPLFPMFWEYYLYSIKIFMAALVTAMFAGIFLTYFTAFLPKRVVQVLSRILSFLEALPDIFVIFVVQFFIIWFYKKTEILLFPIAGAFEKVYFVPIIVLSLLPTLFFYKVSLFMTMEEYEKHYAEFAISKGVRPNLLFLKHIFRNAVIGITSHSKAIIWLMLSNLIILERIFNIYGLTRYILNYKQIEIIAFSLIMFYIPIFLILLISKLVIQRSTGKEVMI